MNQNRLTYLACLLACLQIDPVTSRAADTRFRRISRSVLTFEFDLYTVGELPDASITITFRVNFSCHVGPLYSG
jgi:hypothetical protein